MAQDGAAIFGNSPPGNLYLKVSGDERMKRIAVTVLSFALLVGAVSAQDLNGFANDFEALLVGITRDAAPNLQMSALSGNVVGDATIDRFMFFFPSLGITATDGIAKVLEPGAHAWEFVVPMTTVVNKAVGSNKSLLDDVHALESSFFPYISSKIGFGMAVGHDFDVIVAGMYLPAALTKIIVENAGGSKLSSQGISFDTYNIGVEVRKTILKDAKRSPALSLGLLYNYSALNLSVDNFSLGKMTDGGVDVGTQKLNLDGSISFNTSVHNIGFDVHVSKHLLFFTPFARITGVYQFAETKSDADLTATLGDPGDPSPTTVKIRTSPDVRISGFSTIATLGYDLTVAAVSLNTNVALDLARAEFGVSSLSLSGLSGRGVSLNTGIRVQY
jgi:hypothetical protein